VAILLLFRLPARPQATPPDLASLSPKDPMNTKVGSRTVSEVVNILTRRAAETKGGMVVGGGGNLNQHHFNFCEYPIDILFAFLK
jgi:hypothetical protein